ncbi:LPXTG-domain-containing protein cell wall anchor domain [Enterococcus moraviensis]|nr:LPXTG-domain-containing protein cell wall anchor domain [Enterococcus moraviensis]
MMPKMNKEIVLMGNYVFVVVGIALFIIGLIIYLLTRKKEKKALKYTGLGMMAVGILSVLNNIIQYFIFK